MTPQKARLISNVFSKKVLEDIAAGCTPKKLEEIIVRANLHDSVDGMSYSMFFEWVYSLLLKEYRNEYVYKNAIASKIIIGRHKFANVSYFSEFNAWDVISDVVVANGTTTAYEIKTEYDSFARLERQISTYQQIFDRVYVVVPEPKIKPLLKIIDKNIGILVLTDKYTLSVCREAETNLCRLSHEKIFSCLRKSEYEDITVKYFGSLPEVKPVHVRKHSGELFSTLELDVVHKEFTECLKNRQKDSIRKASVRSMPESLASLGITINLSSARLGQLVRNLDVQISI